MKHLTDMTLEELEKINCECGNAISEYACISFFKSNEPVCVECCHCPEHCECDECLYMEGETE